MQGEPLINGTGIFLGSGESWDFYQGYSITIKSVNLESRQAWIKLSLNDELIQENILSEGKSFNYSHKSEILNLTLDTIYSNPGGELVTFKPVYQYRDPNLPDPIFKKNNGTLTIESNESSSDSSNRSIPGFEIMWAVFGLLLAIFYSHKTEPR